MNGVLSLNAEWLGSEHDYRDAAQVTRQLQPGTPHYLFNADRLRAQASRYLARFPGLVSYAVKANPEARVIRTLGRSGVSHFDVASLPEVQLVHSLLPHATLHYNNPIKAQEAIEQAYRDYGVRSFAVDEMEELLKIRRATGGDPEVMYSVRFRLDHANASYDFGSKFGAGQEQAVALLREVVAGGARAALTFHPGSQCSDPGEYARYLQAAGRIVTRAGVVIELVNVGGGFPQYYDQLDLPSLETYFRVIEEAAGSAFAQAPRLMCEPGRAMVASSVSLLTRVIHLRREEGAVFLNDGIYGGMLEQAIVHLRLPVRVWRAGEQLAGERAPLKVFGPTCDPVDRLPGEVWLPRDLQVGDYVEFGLLGAYGSATSTAFNGFAPAAYLDVAEGFPVRS